MKRGTLAFGDNTVSVWVDDSGDGITASSNRPKESIRFQELAGKYESKIVPNFKPASQSVVKSNIRSLNDYFGRLALSSIDTEKLQEYILASSGDAPKTLKNRLGIMQMIWRKARAWKYIKENPFEFLSMPRTESKEQPFFTPEQCRQIIGMAQEPYRTMFLLAANTGLRAGEILGLRPTDVDLDARTLRVRRSAYRGEIQSPKTGNAVRSVKLAGELCPHLRPFMQSELLFPDRTYDQIMYELNRILESLGIKQKGAGMHCFRRLAASAFSSVLSSDAVIKSTLGHASIAMSHHYMRPLEDDRSRVAEQVWEVLSNAPGSNLRVVPEKVSKAAVGN